MSRLSSPKQFLLVGRYQKSRYIGESTKEKQRVNAAAFAEKWYFQKQMQIQGGNLKHPPRLLNGADIYELATNRRTSPDMIRASYAKHLDGEMMPNINKTKERIDGWGN